MASTILFPTSSPHSVTAIVTGDGAGAGTETRANVLAACSEGPLKALLTKTADWTVFNLGGVLCKTIHVREMIDRAAGPESLATEFFWTAQGIKFDAGSAYQQLEIRCQHTARA